MLKKYLGGGNPFNSGNGSSTTGAKFSKNDIISVIYDNGTVSFENNGILQPNLTLNNVTGEYRFAVSLSGSSFSVQLL